MARSITVVCDDSEAMYPALVDLLARFQGTKKPQPCAKIANGEDAILKAPEVRSGLPSPEGIDVDYIWNKLGKASRRFVSNVAEWCQRNSTLQFTLGDIAEFSGEQATKLKAQNRNVNRVMKSQGVRLWDTIWDGRRRCMDFKILSKAHLDAMVSMI